MVVLLVLAISTVFVAALLVGGTEKLVGGEDYGVPLVDVNSAFKLYRTAFLKRFPKSFTMALYFMPCRTSWRSRGRLEKL